MGPGPDGPMGPPPGDMAEMQSHMDDVLQLMDLKIQGPGNPEHMPGDMDGDGMMPPPPTDDPADDGMG